MMAFSIWDYVIIVLYVAASLAIGLRYTTKQKTVEDYFVADRSARWWAVGISAIATGLSGVSYLGVPAWVFQHDLQFYVVVLLLPIIMLIVIYVFVPLLARLRMMTIYEYLEIRFSVAVRTFASAMFLLLRGGWLATAIYTQSLLVTELIGWPMWVAVVAIGMLTAVYTVLGGIEAVLWTDVMQFFVLVGGILAMIAVLLYSFNGDVVEIWQIAEAGQHTRMFNWEFSLIQITFWGIVLQNFIENLSTYGSDQVMVQRFLTTRNIAEMRRSVMFTGLVSVPVVVLLALVGIGLVAYYHTHPQLAATLTNPDRVVPHFVKTSLPTGLAGLVIAGVFAATMSTLSAGFNSLATATVVDFIRRFRANPPADARAEVTLARVTTFTWALVSTAAALWIGGLGAIIEIFGKINGFFAGPILGVFLLGILTRRPGATAALTALITGTLATWAVSMTPTSWLWYGPTGCFTTCLVGWLLGFIFPAEARVPRDATPA